MTAIRGRDSAEMRVPAPLPLPLILHQPEVHRNNTGAGPARLGPTLLFPVDRERQVDQGGACQLQEPQGLCRQGASGDWVEVRILAEWTVSRRAGGERLEQGLELVDGEESVL